MAKIDRAAARHVPSRRPDPLAILEASSLGRVPQLIPIRYGRMLASPFAFLRGSAAIMANDLANTPILGNKVQACGDCHLINFGLFATPERNLIFDINDFDETLPAPWEWDVKRLATSIILAGRHIAGSGKACARATLAAVNAYRERMAASSTGQRLMQAASDLFLGWFQSLDGRDYYVRQLRDMKASAEIEGMTMSSLTEYAAICGAALARAHARSGDAALISGYLGNSGRFDHAVTDFARRYADQTQRDYDKLVAAVKSGRIRAKVE